MCTRNMTHTSQRLRLSQLVKKKKKSTIKPAHIDDQLWFIVTHLLNFYSTYLLLFLSLEVAFSLGSDYNLIYILP